MLIDGPYASAQSLRLIKKKIKKSGRKGMGKRGKKRLLTLRGYFKMD